MPSQVAAITAAPLSRVGARRRHTLGGVTPVMGAAASSSRYAAAPASRNSAIRTTNGETPSPGRAAATSTSAAAATDVPNTGQGVRLTQVMRRRAGRTRPRQP